MLLKDGMIVTQDTSTINPRTAIGVSKDQCWVIIILWDGNEKNHTGATLLALADKLQDYGAYNGISLDGGMDTDGAVLGADRETYILNVPSSDYIEGNEAPVANCLGMRFPTPPLFNPTVVPEVVDVKIDPVFTLTLDIGGVEKIVSFPQRAPVTFNTQGMSWIVPDWMSPTWNYTSRCIIKRIKVGIPQTVKCKVDTFFPATEPWQRYWYGLLRMQAPDLSESVLQSRWLNLTKSDKFLTNFHGSDKGHDFITGQNSACAIHISVGKPKISGQSKAVEAHA